MATVDENILARSDIDPANPRVVALKTLAAEKSFNSCYDENTINALQALWVLHWHTLGPDGTGANESGAVGSVKSEKEGDLAISYGSMDITNTKDAYLAQTQYGMEILSIRKANIFGPRTKMGPCC